MGVARWLDLLYAAFGAAGFAVVFRTPRRYFLQTMLVGVAAIFGLKTLPLHWHDGAKALVTSLGIACLAHLFARVTSAPAQCFLIPGVIFLVPGTTIYKALSAALERHYTDAVTLGATAAAITMGVSFGLLLANWFVPPRKTL
jgi:uncharacterized membrane protein YjjB (DUF3815 family)